MGKHPLVCRLLKGVFNLRLPLPRYNSSWDVTKVTTFVKTMGDNDKMSLKLLTQKLAIQPIPLEEQPQRQRPWQAYLRCRSWRGLDGHLRTHFASITRPPAEANNAVNFGQAVLKDSTNMQRAC